MSSQRKERSKLSYAGLASFSDEKKKPANTTQKPNTLSIPTRESVPVKDARPGESAQNSKKKFTPTMPTIPERSSPKSDTKKPAFSIKIEEDILTPTSKNGLRRGIV